MKATRSLLISCFLTVAASQAVGAHMLPRQILGGGPSQATTGTTSATTATSAAASTTDTSSDTTSSSASPTTSSVPTTTSQPTTTSTSAPTTSTLPPAVTTTSTPTLPPVLSTSTDAGGSTVIVTATTTPASTTSSSASATATNSDSDGSSGLGTGSIVGIAVAGGVAIIGIIAFIVWKFTRKRFGDFDDNEAIKWPELNAHGENMDSHAMPVHNTGRAGFGDTGSEHSLSRVPSASNYSTPDVGGSDPYAVPPLPHMNPNQPYRDDPTGASGYYDPYRGPVPGTLEQGAVADDWAGEVIPMTQMAGRTSPGPHAAYGVAGYDTGRASPAPYGAQQAAYGGRNSPGPQAAYAGRASPGAQGAYNTGRASPGPQAAYDPYGAR
ncbi:hypothetical protein H0H92_009413 [Tricholoma furcatifolium]|nr:hypothetical protein H0H92_009413 [Tricholoma furcatifolium]